MPEAMEILQKPFMSKIRVAQFVLAILIFAALVLMPNPAALGLHQKDVVLHFIGNVLLMLSAWVACIGRFNPVVPLLFAISYSVILELSQYLTASRTPQLHDLVANISGIIAGFIIASLLNKFFIKKNTSNK